MGCSMNVSVDGCQAPELNVEGHENVMLQYDPFRAE